MSRRPQTPARTRLAGPLALALAAALAPGCGQAGEDIAVEPPRFAPGDGPSSVTANTTRLTGDDPLADAVAVTQAVYPATIANENTPGAVVLAPVDDLAMQLTAVQVTHHPINAPVLYADDDGIPDVVRTELRRLVPEGVAQDAHNYTFVTTTAGDVPPAAVTATVLSHLGKHGPLLVIEPDTVPDEVRRFLDERRPTYVTPNEALHNHGWVIGDDITPEVQAELDALLAVEREPPTTRR